MCAYYFQTMNHVPQNLVCFLSNSSLPALIISIALWFGQPIFLPLRPEFSNVYSTKVNAMILSMPSI